MGWDSGSLAVKSGRFFVGERIRERIEICFLSSV